MAFMTEQRNMKTEKIDKLNTQAMELEYQISTTSVSNISRQPYQYQLTEGLTKRER